MSSGKILVEWDAAGKLDIRTSLAIASSEGRKAAIEKLLDAARAVNNQGTPLALPDATGVRLFGNQG